MFLEKAKLLKLVSTVPINWNSQNWEAFVANYEIDCVYMLPGRNNLEGRQGNNYFQESTFVKQFDRVLANK